MRYLMRYVKNQSLEASPQLLQLRTGGRTYALSILHATLEETRSSGSPAHTHALYHIVLFTRGRGRFLLNGREIAIRPGMLVLTSPGEAHDFGVHGQGALAYREVTFELRDGELLAQTPFHDVLSLYSGQPLPPVSFPVALKRAATQALDHVFRRLLEHLTGEATLDLFRSHIILAELFDAIIQSLHGAQLERPEATPPLERARRLIERRATERLVLGEVATEAHLAPAYLCRAFKARFGQSPIAYHQRQRLEAAQRMLTTTSLSCKEIATRLGYADVFTFSKAFKRLSRVSPAAYRQQN